MCGGVAHSWKNSKCTTDRKHRRRMTECSTSVLATFLGFRKLLNSCTEGMCLSSTHPGTSSHMTQFYQALPCISTASDEHWVEKAWVPGYTNPTQHLHSQHTHTHTTPTHTPTHTIPILTVHTHNNVTP